MKNTLTDEEFEIRLSMAEREQYLSDNPHITQIFTKFPATLDSVRLGIRKPDRAFNDVLQKAKNAHHHSTIDTR
jgi:hypothetical protein